MTLDASYITLCIIMGHFESFSYGFSALFILACAAVSAESLYEFLTKFFPKGK